MSEFILFHVFGPLKTKENNIYIYIYIYIYILFLKIKYKLQLMEYIILKAYIN